MILLVPVEDNRAGYQRQQDEDRKAVWTCECGAVVREYSSEFHHIGPCSVPVGQMSTLTLAKKPIN